METGGFFILFSFHASNFGGIYQIIESIVPKL